MQFNKILKLAFLLICIQTNCTNNIRLLVLVLASDGLPVYIAEQDLWRSYMHYNPDQVTSFFIKGNPNLPSRYSCDRDIIWSKTSEGHTPHSAGIINKTVISLEALEQQLDNFDYIVRTNMSSFFIFPRMLEYLDTLPRENVYCGILGENYVSGAGIIISTDIAKLILRYKNELLNNTTFIDDVLIGKFMERHNISMTGYTGRVDIASLGEWHKVKNFISTKAFHFRLVNLFGRRNTDEVYVYKQLINMFYRK
jgi:hypothetical protein